uniref:nucleosome assembly protein 1;3-like n=1 Tax=Fragaria vesca subsp. vesca TaxID=101020 RepID=UPI0005C83BC1|nr:PREDICTED: nucleosome assembly protein 1;3-like [Fragaria vesca subsp. vesca]XP_011460163.1 PREDICTED: nucleosome assembly protein 1;3-like [Fragaria vesca subsp. vesca]XP_011460164.1 PREDICTED: nucleosome assembly protein 1;3-like [Fragaria vesca subsp. vesca]
MMSCVGGNGDDRPALNPTKLHRFPPDTRKRIEHLIQIQKDHDELKAQFYKDRGALEAKYEKLYQPLYDKRYNIMNGIGVTTDSESPTTNQGEKGIPEFWLYALNAMYVLDKEIKDYDQGALKHLVNIKWLRTDNLKVFKLEFYFRPNPFFKNSVLTVTYHMIDEDEFIIEKIIGTEIEWTSENRLKKHRTGNRRSFFDLFSPPEAHNDCKNLKLKDILQGNYLIGSIIRDDIIPRAVLWFTGEAELEQFEEMSSVHESFLKRLSLDVQKRVDRLRKIQKDHDGLKAQFYRERAELEASYQKAYNDMYNERYRIVNGVVEAEKLAKDSEVGNQSPEEKGVPEFWRHALVNHELLETEISIPDGEALKYITDIRWFRKDDSKGFILQFYFDKNPFFTNTVLTKTYQLLDEDETILHKALGTEIEWYAGNCLTRECESFFNFFNPVRINEKAREELVEVMRRDYYIGSTIRNEIIPRAVLWYLGEAVQGDKEFGIKESEESDEDVDEESEGEESEDEVSEEEVSEEEESDEGKESEGEESEDEVSEDEGSEDE